MENAGMNDTLPSEENKESSSKDISVELLSGSLGRRTQKSGAAGLRKMPLYHSGTLNLDKEAPDSKAQTISAAAGFHRSNTGSKFGNSRLILKQVRAENSDEEFELSEADLTGVDYFFKKNVETIKHDSCEDSESSDS